jgi:hypothetical protein
MKNSCLDYRGRYYYWNVHAKGINNNAVVLNQSVEQSWGNVQTAYQRRNDLIGNLVNTVKVLLI